MSAESRYEGLFEYPLTWLCVFHFVLEILKLSLPKDPVACDLADQDTRPCEKCVLSSFASHNFGRDHKYQALY